MRDLKFCILYRRPKKLIESNTAIKQTVYDQVIAATFVDIS